MYKNRDFSREVELIFSLWKLIFFPQNDLYYYYNLLGQRSTKTVNSRIICSMILYVVAKSMLLGIKATPSIQITVIILEKAVLYYEILYWNFNVTTKVKSYKICNFLQKEKESSSVSFKLDWYTLIHRTTTYYI